MSDTLPTLMSSSPLDPDRTAIVDQGGTHSYDALHGVARRVATRLLENGLDLGEKRVALLAPPGFDFAASLLGIWQAGGVAIPLCLSHPVPELAYVLADASVKTLLFHPDYQELATASIGQKPIDRISISQIVEEGPAPGLRLDGKREALVLYTSGTTSRPKGALSTHANLMAQIHMLVQAWDWSETDRLLHVLPLHHTHGLVNALLCPLRVGASCQILPKFDTHAVWEAFAGGGITVFMAVPTIYAQLIEHWQQAGSVDQQRMRQAVTRLRLMVSGSAALPQTVFESWKQISGKPLLERYGMTEIGMALSNPLHGDKRPGSVGMPLPGVEIRLVDESGQEVAEGEAGEILVRGPAVFKGYLGRPDDTSRAFSDGWFRTGDQAVVEDGYHRILGRISQDIIKSGGYKLSALEIEEALRAHPRIRECAVMGIPDEKWGERVAVALSLSSGETLSLDQLRDWAADRLARYKIPSRLAVLEQLPRNAMGKVVKTELAKLFD